MTVTFVRQLGARDRVYVERSDGSEASWSFPSYGDGLPHDLVHLVLERRLGMTDGIWARVAAGLDLEQANRIADRVGGKGKYEAGFGEKELLGVARSESLAGVPWGNPDFGPEALLGLIQENHQRFGASVDPRVDVAFVRATGVELDALRGRWRQAQPKGSLRLNWTDPEEN